MELTIEKEVLEEADQAGNVIRPIPWREGIKHPPIDVHLVSRVVSQASGDARQSNMRSTE